MTVQQATATSPTAPGKLGDALDPAAIQTYLGELDTWLRVRRSELDELDRAALGAGRGGELAGDMSLALALWKAISDRYQLVFATWDGGRVLQQERERISALVWGRLDGATELPGGLAVSLPEAGRLCDALTGQLRTRLSLAPDADRSAARIRDLRAQLERIRDQVGLEPANSRDAAIATLAGLMSRLEALTAKAERGGDVGGMLGPLETEATTFERDLIVGNARRRDARSKVLSARELRADLEAREAALAKLAQTCVDTVDPAPRYAVPDVDLLGPVPVTPDEIEPYLQRLDRVSQAMEVAQHAYSAALEEHTQLVGLLDGYVTKARASGVAGHPDLAESERAARALLERRPCPMVVARQLVTTYQTWLSSTKETK
ncbi:MULTISPECIES: hypothetical protein [unclassified Nocardioides]|uniref:hypothetical protein n=1 Tax=unclassified Nocardioides TaxID=2615069 RepID=UPI0007026F07|nr:MULTISPECIES: hypothetical protein [unclassified Nocardioides]KRC54902.1 hypothetical protein ASE19_05455 [Nocardioides sp. Root79]KRC73754.1 hypothetical protein ASE20_03765 [Nocardioides sp. Root240]